MTAAVIVQARFGSTRLPGKVLQPIGGQPALVSVLERCHRIPGIDVVVCAIPDERTSDPVADVARAAGAVVFRGAEADVLDRYDQAARCVGATSVMRITSDCPLIDPLLCGAVLAALGDEGVDYVCNNMPPLWPHGLDCEAFWAEHLARAALEAVHPYEREHVTPWLRRNAALRRVSVDGPGGGLERLRWTLDYTEDYSFFCALAEILRKPFVEASTQDVLAALTAHPELAAINRGRIDEARLSDRSVSADLRLLAAA
ncbi:MAG TPA: glycosyltransferase family protein [Stellaceae bacterium]|nr:glycosyltransferase family protein [Stellaceae bacterium]